MSAEQRKRAASLAAKARWSGKQQPVSIEDKKEAALRKIASILEEQMTAMGLSEEEKNSKTAELVSFVSDAVTSKLSPHAKQQEQRHIEALQA